MKPAASWDAAFRFFPQKLLRKKDPAMPIHSNTFASRSCSTLVATFLALITLAGCNTTGQNRLDGPPTLTVYNAPPLILQTEAQKRDAGINAIVGWHADLDDSEGEDATTIGVCTGTMQVTRLEKDTEHRMTLIELDWNGNTDSIVVGGSHPYPKKSIETDTPILRGILGGTGKYHATRGHMVSTRLPSGWYRHEIWLID